MPLILSDFWAPAGPLVLTVVELGGSNHVIDSLSPNDATEDLYHVVGEVLQIPAERLTLVVGTTVLPNVSGQTLHSLSLTSQSVVTAIRNAARDDEVPDYDDRHQDHGYGCTCYCRWIRSYNHDWWERMMTNDKDLQTDLQMDQQEHYDDKNHSFDTRSVQAVGFGATELLRRLRPMDPPRPGQQNADLKNHGFDKSSVALDCYFRRMERFNWQPCDPRIMHLLASAAPPFIAKVHGHDRLRRALTGRRGLDLKALQKNLCLRIIVKDEQILCWLSVDALPQVPIDCVKCPSDPSLGKIPWAPEGLTEQLLGKFYRSTSALQTHVNMVCLQVLAAELEWHTPKHTLRNFRNCSLSCQAELCVLLSMLCGFDEYDAYEEECDECECDDVCWDAWDALTMDPKHRTKTSLQDIFYEPNHIWHKFRKSSSSCLVLLRDLCSYGCNECEEYDECWCAVVPDASGPDLDASRCAWCARVPHLDEERVWSRAYSSCYGCNEREEFDECWCAVVPDEERVWSRAYSSAPWDAHFRCYGCNECKEYDEYEEYDKYDVYNDTCWDVWDGPDLTDKDSEQVLAPLPRDPRRTMEIYLQDNKIKQTKRLALLAVKDSFEKMKREQRKAGSQSCEKLKRGQHKVESRLSARKDRHKVDPRLFVKGIDY